MRVLITGAGGFVGRHVVEALRSLLSADVDVLMTARLAGQDILGGPIEGLDITDAEAVRAAIARYRCTHVMHLAGVASVTAATANPEAAWQIHVSGTLNIARAIVQECPDCTLIFVGSGQVYGLSALTPADEHTLLDPPDNYTVTKAAADLAVGAMARNGLRCLRMRPFNHTGPGQSESFVVPSFAMQIARIEAGLQPPVMGVGNLEAERDFLDVRDVASAYVLAALKSSELPNGLILNIASGTPHSIQSILDRLLGLSRIQIKVEQDPSRMRPTDMPRIVGDASAACRLLGWQPKFNLDQTLHDLLQDCRNRVAREIREPAVVGP